MAQALYGNGGSTARYSIYSKPVPNLLAKRLNLIKLG